jgi:hypothetical protein
VFEKDERNIYVLRFFLFLFEEGRKETRKDGRKRGRREGRKEGRREGYQGKISRKGRYQ